MRVAIAGAGNVGLFIANDLAATGHEVQLIEQNPAVVERAVAAEGVEWFIADACEVSSLKEAGLERCDVVVAATGDDEDNLVISPLSRQEFAVPRIVARALKDIDMPRDATVVAVVRGEHVVMPRGDTTFEVGDEVLAMVTPDSEENVRGILTGEE